MESVFIEIDSTYFGTSSNVAIGIVYRMSGSSVEVFNERITDVMNVIHREKNVLFDGWLEYRLVQMWWS